MDSPASAPGANLAALRDHNTAAVLRAVRAAGEISRVELATATGLTAQAISKIVLRLTAAGLLADAGRGRSTGGKPRTLLRLVPDARWAVGAQLGRDGVTLLLADLTGRVVTSAALPADMGRPPAEVLDRLAAQIEDLIDGSPAGGAASGNAASGNALPGGATPLPRERLLGVGVASPGPLDQRSGILHRVTGRPEWDGIALGSELAARLGLLVVVDKDTTAGVLSQAGSADRAFIYLDGCSGPGTGPGAALGAGLVLGGRVQRGARTNAGEFGHQVLDPDGPPCACGSQGCLEALCRTALEAGSVDRAARFLGEGIANLVRLLDVDEVVLGGSAVLADAECYRATALAVLRERLPDPDWQGVDVSVVRAGGQAVALGAAGLVLATLYGDTPG
ncbi:ROK family protein [Streptacidiphilus sp. EB129]|uniref:ROK family protein n=1 Tax=Streptacidiphilus sp. EB129 TaxID=3156262 RepID=UPI0035139068